MTAAVLAVLTGGVSFMWLTWVATFTLLPSFRSMLRRWMLYMRAPTICTCNVRLAWPALGDAVREWVTGFTLEPVDEAGRCARCAERERERLEELRRALHVSAASAVFAVSVGAVVFLFVRGNP